MTELESKVKLGSGEYVTFKVSSENAVYSELQWYTKLYNLKTIMDRSSVYPRFRLFVLNEDESVHYRLPDEDVKLGGSYSENYQNGSRRTLSFSLINEEGKYNPGINGIPVGTKIKLELGIEIPEKQVNIWFDGGIYVVNKNDPSRTTEGITASINCADKFSIFEGTSGVIPHVTKFDMGTPIKEIFLDIMRQSTGNGFLLDYKDIRYDPIFDGKKLPIDIIMQSGSNWSSVLVQLAEILSAEVFYDRSGYLNVIPIVETMNDGSKPMIYSFSDEDGTIISEDISNNMDEWINKIYVIGREVNGHTCIGEAENNDPSSPISIQRIGLRVGQIVNDTNISNDILAQERAEYELRQKIIANATLSLQVFFNPLLSVNNIVMVSDGKFGFKNDRFLIQSVSFSIGYDGVVSLSLSNINNLPFMS